MTEKAQIRSILCTHEESCSVETNLENIAKTVHD